MDRIGIEELKLIFGSLKKIMDENREYLIELDSIMGDSDLGLTMQKSFDAANNEAQGFSENNTGKLFMMVGMKIAQTAPSTMGTLMATGFMKGGKAVLKKELLNIDDLSLFFRAFSNGIMAAGKTKPGNKTIVDALDPAATVLEKAAAENKTIKEGLEKAHNAALDGVEKSKQFEAQHGRAAYYREKSIGVQDPGATVGALLLKGFLQGIS